MKTHHNICSESRKEVNRKKEETANWGRRAIKQADTAPKVSIRIHNLPALILIRTN